jgi:hypothetical protein
MSLQQKTILSGTLICLSLGSLVGCGSDHAFPSAPMTATQYWRLSLNHHAVTLALTAPANQLQLAAIPLTVTGDTLVADARVHFTSSDSAVQVDSTGLLTAHSPKAGVLVIATLTVGGTHGVTLADTTQVNVNQVATIPVFTRFELHAPGDSARCAMDPFMGGGLCSPMTVDIYDAADSIIANTQFYLTVLDTTVLTIARNKGHWKSTGLNANAAGQTRVIAEATVYGIKKSDTIDVTVGYPLYQMDSLKFTRGTTASFDPQEFKISLGGIVIFMNDTHAPLDILFDDSTAAESVPYEQLTSAFLLADFFFAYPETGTSAAGNIHALAPLDTGVFTHEVGFDIRRFLHPGTYPFTSRPSNARGVVHVVE